MQAKNLLDTLKFLASHERRQFTKHKKRILVNGANKE